MGSAALFGREEESRRLSDLIAQLPHSGGALIVRGDPGIGKTALAEQAASDAARAGCAVMQVTGSATEMQLPFAALHELLQPHLEKLPALRPRQQDALRAALGMGARGTPDLFLVGLAVLDLLSEVGGDSGVLVVFDDVHWLDASTAQILGFVARRLRSEPVAMVLTLRPGHASGLLDANLPVIDLSPLSNRDASALVETARPDLRGDERGLVLDLAQGNPLALLELPSSTPSAASDPRSPGMTDRLQRAFAVRFESLTASARRVLLIAAVDDTDLVSEVLAAANAMAPGGTAWPTVLDEAVATGAVRIDGSVVRFRHPLVRSAVIEVASADDTRAAHAAFAQVAADPDRAAWHLAASSVGPAPLAAAALQRVAERANAQGNPAVAMRAWEAASARSAEPAERARLLLRAAETAVEMGQSSRAGALAGQVKTTDLSGLDEARLALLRNSLDPKTHTAPRIGQLIAHSRDALAAGEIDLAVSLLLAAGDHLNQVGFAVDSSEAAAAASQLVSVLGRDDPRTLAVLAAIDPTHYAREIIDRVSRMDITGLDPAMELLVQVAFMVDADTGLASLQAALIDNHRVRGRMRSIAHLQAQHSWTQIALANWPEAIEAADEGVRLSHEIGLPQREAGAMIGLAMVAASRGDDVEARRLISASESIAITRGAQDVLTGVQLTRGVRLIAIARYDDAVSALKRVFDPLTPRTTLSRRVGASVISRRRPITAGVPRRCEASSKSSISVGRRLRGSRWRGSTRSRFSKRIGKRSKPVSGPG